MKENNIKLNNIKPFFNEKVITKNSIKLNELLSNKDTSIPLIPGIYFYQNDNPLKFKNDNLGSEIINKYYSIKSNLDKLITNKNFIDSILDTNKYDLEKIKIQREKYKLFKKTTIDDTNLFSKFKFKSNLDETVLKQNDIFYKFLKDYEKKNYSFMNNKNDIPLFYSIFQNEYNEESNSKSFFKKLFKEYVSLRNELVKELIETDKVTPVLAGQEPEHKGNYGLLAFSFIFNLSKKTSIENNILQKKQNDLIDYEIYGKINQNQNNSYKVGDIIYSTPSKPITIKSIDFKNYPDKPYLLSNNYYYTSNNLNKIKAQSTTIPIKTKPTLENKIDDMSQLYNPSVSKNVFKSNYNTNINKLYENLYKSIKNLFENDSTYNLYNVLKNYLELDLNIIIFLFNYVDKLKYNKAVDIHYEIIDYIFSHINKFDNYYPLYIKWFNNLSGVVAKTNISTKNNIQISDFKSYFDTVLGKISTP
jgi:hypothetical protein